MGSDARDCKTGTTPGRPYLCDHLSDRKANEPWDASAGMTESHCVPSPIQRVDWGSERRRDLPKIVFLDKRPEPGFLFLGPGCFLELHCEPYLGPCINQPTHLEARFWSQNNWVVGCD